MVESPSILNSTKKALSIPADYVVFDPELITYINGVFGTLQQLGVGPPDGFRIDDNTAIWDEFLEQDNRLNSVKTFMCMSVRLVFDPPPTSFGIAAVQQQIQELAWRINVQREEEAWTEPPPKPERRR